MLLNRENLQKHTGVGRSFAAKVSMNTRGTISISDGAIRRYGLHDYDFVVLYFGGQQRLVVIEPADAKAEGAMKLRKRTTGGYIAAQSFVGNFQIELERTTIYELKLDKESGLLYFELDAGKQRKTGEDL